MTTPLKNPGELTFESPDHDHPDVVGYEVDINKANPDGTAGELVQTIEVAKGELVNGRVVIKVNVRPEKMGQYVFTARTRTTDETVESDTSSASDVWLRAPGKPTALSVGL